MDDPWGSPWTTGDNDKDQKAPPSPTKSDLEPPPRAFLSVSSSPRIPTIVSKSPWADDDDGFGDWAAPDAGASAQSGWGGGWASPSPSLTLPSRDDEFGKASPIAWPGSIAIPKSTSGSSIRQPSPDPWAAEFSAGRPTSDGPSTPRPIAADIEDTIVEEKGNETTSIIITSEWDDHEVLDSGERKGNAHEDAFVLPPSEEPPAPEEQLAATAGDAASARSSFDSPTRGRALRSSSPSDRDSDQEDERQDSPITSIDEDSRARQEVARKEASGKVQELVVKFDGLARAARQEPPAVSRERSKSSSDRNRGSSTAGVHRDLEHNVDELPQRPSTPVEEVPAARVVGESPISSRASPRDTQSPRSRASTVESKKQSVAKLEPVFFDTDLGKLDQLFAKMTEPARIEASGVRGDVSDHIITDSFTEISERKTWYRISRLGSSRMHNAGDDENYRRVGWDSSTVRVDTIKIVRRWMEEDSIAGRANLGGGASKNQRNMFGWDSAAEPVALDAVFGKKKSHGRTSSLKKFAPIQPPSFPPQSPNSTAERKVSGALNGAAQRPLSLNLPAPASFGWSTDSPVTQTNPAIPPPLSRSPVVAAVGPAPSRPVTQPSVPDFPPPAPAPAQEVPKPFDVTPVATHPPLFSTTAPAPLVISATIQDDDEDDDWGEMVMSPSEANHATSGFIDLADAIPAPLPASSGTNLGGSIAPAPVSVPAPAPAPAPAPVPVASTNTDAWASVNFSIFEKPAESAKRPTLASPALVTPTTTTSPSATTPFTPAVNTIASLLSPTSVATPISAASKESMVAASSHFTPTTPLQIVSPVALPVLTEGTSGPNNTDTGVSPVLQPDEAVLHIIANLPDLSYMLR